MWYLIVINKIILTPYHSSEFFHYQLIQKQSLYLKGLIRNRRWYHPSMVWSFPPFALIMVYTLFLFFFLFLSLFTFRIWLSMSLSIYLFIYIYIVLFEESKKNKTIDLFFLLFPISSTLLISCILNASRQPNIITENNLIARLAFLQLPCK